MTPNELTLVSAFLVGFVGSTHCLGMCGGIIGALSLGAKRNSSGSAWSLLPYLIAYNVGRVTTYACMGAAFGLLGAQVLQAVPSPRAQLVAHIISGGFMVALGFYLTGWWSGLGALERVGARLWRRIEPLGRRLLPVTHPARAFLVGLVWGWLPCGLVYAALAWSLSSGGGVQGAALMAAFGAGTLPMLFVLGAAARWLGAAVRVPMVRRTAGMVVLLFGAYTLWASGSPMAHMHHQIIGS
jgi:uncharacterized protein